MTIKTCTCKHEFQDAEYGPNQRVHNYAPKGYSGRAGWRCTVCSDVKPQKTPTKAKSETNENK